MYIIKNAFKCMARSKGRNMLIGVIVFVIAVSACLGLSIRQAAENAEKEAMADLRVTAAISVNRSAMMKDMQPPSENESFDKSDFKDKFSEISPLSLEDYKTYAKASTVKDFYYTVTASFNGYGNFEAVTSNENDSANSEKSENGGDFGGQGSKNDPGFRRNVGDFQIVGVSSENAMEAFISGSASVSEGTIFSENTTDLICLISEELSAYNGIGVGDEFTLCNANIEDEDSAEIYKLTVCGIYSDTSSNEVGFSMFGASQDPANKIYMSYAALNSILEKSSKAATITTDEKTGRKISSAVVGTISATYVCGTADDYYAFEKEVRNLGLSEDYSVSSTDIQSFENSLTPLKTLSQMATTFLIVILAIGAAILIVLNVFNIRERKYEIGVLTAMGMKKGKVALQFLLEIFAVTLAAVIIGAAIGGATSVPVTNKLLENQVASSNEKQSSIEQNFGRPGNNEGTNAPESHNNGVNPMANMFGGKPENNYVTSVSSAMNITVVIQMLGIAILLTVISGAVSMLFVMRYEPLKILANRD